MKLENYIPIGFIGFSGCWVGTGAIVSIPSANSGQDWAGLPPNFSGAAPELRSDFFVGALGGPGRGSYFLFSFPVELEERCHVRGVGSNRKCIKEVFVKELTGLAAKQFRERVGNRENERLALMGQP